MLLSPGSTRGLQLADRELASMLSEAGASVLTCRLGPLRRWMGDPFDDLREGYAARRALRLAVARHNPRTLVLSTPTSALLASVRGRSHAIWFDQPAPFHLRGIRNAVVRTLERRALVHAELLMPYSAGAMDLVSAPDVPSVIVPTPVAESCVSPDRPRDNLVVTYAGGPWDKGLDLMCKAWARIDPDAGTRFVITGIQADQARRFLADRHGLLNDARVEFTGMLSQTDFIELLARARVFFTASRSEGFGQAALQALDAGAILVGAPGRGPFPALALARSLNAKLVATGRSTDLLAGALARALAMNRAEQVAYRIHALALLTPYRRPVIVATLRDEVLPVLLGDAPG